jgi:hypothetical protein
MRINDEKKKIISLCFLSFGVTEKFASPRTFGQFVQAHTESMEALKQDICYFIVSRMYYSYPITRITKHHTVFLVSLLADRTTKTREDENELPQSLKY